MTQGTEWLAPGDKLNLQIKATVTDSLTGQVWKLQYNAVVRDGEWDEDFRFQPAK